MIETKQKERLRRLSECIKRSGRIHLKEAARILEVSEMTIRRDLNADTEGPIPMSLLGGYIVSVTQPSSLTSKIHKPISLPPTKLKSCIFLT